MAAAHVVTCEGARAAAAAVCSGRAWRSVAQRCWARRGGERVPARTPVISFRPQPPARSPRAPFSAFRLQPVGAPEMNFAISSEMTQVTRCTRAPREGEGGVGRWWLCGASRCPRRHGHRGAPRSCGCRLARGGWGVGTGRARWSGTFLRRGGDRLAPPRWGDGGPRDLAQRTARKDDPPDESGGHRGP